MLAMQTVRIKLATVRIKLAPFIECQLAMLAMKTVRIKLATVRIKLANNSSHILSSHNFDKMK